MKVKLSNLRPSSTLSFSKERTIVYKELSKKSKEILCKAFGLPLSSTSEELLNEFAKKHSIALLKGLQDYFALQKEWDNSIVVSSSLGNSAIDFWEEIDRHSSQGTLLDIGSDYYKFIDLRDLVQENLLKKFLGLELPIPHLLGDCKPEKNARNFFDIAFKESNVSKEIVGNAMQEIERLTGTKVLEKLLQ